VLEQGLERGDLAALEACLFSGEDPGKSIEALQGLRKSAPSGLQGLLDLWTGELSGKKGWKLKAYEAYSRALRWEPLAESVLLLDRLSRLASALNEPETAFEHAERALSILERRKSSVPLGPRFKKMVETFSPHGEIWKERGREILERWARAEPRNPEPFQSLAALFRDSGWPARALRYASQEIELRPSPETYSTLARELDGIGDTARAEACRVLAARLEKKK
jgi:tetratricopeptide (TPR) repeat protein